MLASSASACPGKHGRSPVRLAGGAGDMATVVRALDEAGVGGRGLELDPPSLDDVFAEATGRRLEGADQDGEAAERDIASEIVVAHAGAVAAVDLRDGAPAPAGGPIGGLAPHDHRPGHGVAGALDVAARLPAVDSFLDFAMATTILQGVLFGAIGAGVDMAVDIEGGLLRPPGGLAVSAPGDPAGRLAGARRCWPLCRRWCSSSSSWPSAASIEGGVRRLRRRPWCAALSASASAGSAAALAAAHRITRSGAGHVPGVLHLPVPVLGVLPRGLMSGLVQDRAP